MFVFQMFQSNLEGNFVGIRTSLSMNLLKLEFHSVTFAMRSNENISVSYTCFEFGEIDKMPIRFELLAIKLLSHGHKQILKLDNKFWNAHRKSKTFRVRLKNKLISNVHKIADRDYFEIFITKKLNCITITLF